MQNYLLTNLSDFAQKRAVLMREEALLWDILSRDLVREARRLDDAVSNRPARPSRAPELLTPAREGERKLLVGITEAARMMGLGRSSLYKEIGASRLKARKAGKRTLIAVGDIEEWCNTLPGRTVD
jgi:hypothetical protein